MQTFEIRSNSYSPLGHIQSRRTSSIKHRTTKASGRKTIFWRNTFLRNELRALNQAGMVKPHNPAKPQPVVKTTQFTMRADVITVNTYPQDIEDEDDDFSPLSREKQRIANAEIAAEKYQPFRERYWYGAGKNQPSYETVIKRIVEDFEVSEQEACDILTANV